ncbi:hypothetical protein A1342_09275 [Methylomonas methanica]|uniref:Uncharacterized protein n=1 Tax=Methylomonas denitrificans TaxID=1538553 RepID=A0A140E7A2_9GAMM|nr:hypothetical protein JT25_022780 [Methylomonas denitrificans]OAI03289.1 hypothetical protein A1342_09275 [Methylomonas methanica]
MAWKHIAEIVPGKHDGVYIHIGFDVYATGTAINRSKQCYIQKRFPSMWNSFNTGNDTRNRSLFMQRIVDIAKIFRAEDPDNLSDN